MRTFIISTSIVGLLVAAPALSAKDVNPKDLIDQIFADNDWNGDGGLDFSEFENMTYGNGGSLAEASNGFQRSDVNGDGLVTSQEYFDNLPST